MNAVEALKLLQQGDARGALEMSRRLLASQPRNARAYLAAGLALRQLGRLEESRAALENAAGLDPGDYGAAFELGNACELAAQHEAALAQYARSATLRPAFLPARHALGFALHRAGRVAEALAHLAAAAGQPLDVRWVLDHAKALLDLGHFEAAQAEYLRALAMAPGDVAAHVESGRFFVARGLFAEAAHAFAAACRLDPARIEWPMYLAQVELLRGRWAEGWKGYRFREQRLLFEQQRAALGNPYQVPSLEELRGGAVTLVREQGLGDELFFLRLAPALKAAGVKLAYAGDARLLPLLARTQLFGSLRDIDREPPRSGERVLLTADLPLLVEESALFAPPLPVAPREDAVAAVRERLDGFGPRPWIALTWRAGTPRSASAEALSKEIPLEALASAVASLPGTLVALQRVPRLEDLRQLGARLGRALHDASVGDDLEQALALATLVDRHVGVSSTNMHLAASAGATADVLVPFPPEWRWRMEGESPWFPGFRIHRQDRDGGWAIRL